jgi:phospholipase C
LPFSADTLAMVRPSDSSGGKIDHVVVIFQENRSFDNLFQGYPGADTQSYGYRSNGVKVPLHPVGLEADWDIDHSSQAFYDACDGSGPILGTHCKMDGFDREPSGCYNDCAPNPQYGYVPHQETRLYFAMARQYVLGDRTFASNFDGSSFVSHQYIIRAQASSTVDFPMGPWGCGATPRDTIGTVKPPRKYGPKTVPCFDGPTLGDELDAAHLPWRFYAAATGEDAGSIWSAYQAIDHIRFGPDWATDVSSPPSNIFADIRRGKLAAMSWVTPTCIHSDHAGCGSNTGPAWVATIVNSIGRSKFWKSTAIFVMWDDYGGWYDHVPPPFEDYDGLGIRVPLLVISPYAKAGYVSHVQYEHGSILRFIEDQFGLPRLAASDRRANSPAADCFDFTQRPRAFHPFAVHVKEEDFEREPPDRRPPDEQ